MGYACVCVCFLSGTSIFSRSPVRRELSLPTSDRVNDAQKVRGGIHGHGESVRAPAFCLQYSHQNGHRKAYVAFLLLPKSNPDISNQVLPMEPKCCCSHPGRTLGSYYQPLGPGTWKLLAPTNYPGFCWDVRGNTAGGAQVATGSSRLSPCASASLPLTLPLCCSERCSVRVRVMSSTLDAPYTWGKMKNGLKASSGTPALAPKGFLNSSCKEGSGAGEEKLFAQIPRPLGK